MKRTIFFALLLLGVGCSYLIHNAPNAISSLREMQEDMVEYPFLPTGSLKIDNTNGSMVIRTHDANTLIVESVKKRQQAVLTT